MSTASRSGSVRFVWAVAVGGAFLGLEGIVFWRRCGCVVER